MIVDAVGIALPDLDHGTAHDLAALVEHPAGHVRDVPDGLGRLTLHAHQVRIVVGRKRDRIERPFGLSRRHDQR